MPWLVFFVFVFTVQGPFFYIKTDLLDTHFGLHDPTIISPGIGNQYFLKSHTNPTPHPTTILLTIFLMIQV